MLPGAARALRRASAETPALALADQFVFVDPSHLLRIAAVIAAGAGGVTATVTSSPLAALIVVGAFLALPALAQRFLRRRRSRRLASQFPDVAMALASGLRAGASLHQTLGQIAETAPRPIADEIALVVRKQRIGVPVERALRDMADRVRGHDFRLLAATIALAGQVGGGLAPSLERLAVVARRRRAMEARIEALTSQGRLQGLILALLPVVLLFVLSAMEPETMQPLIGTPIGWLTLAAMGALEVLGWLLIRRIVAIDV